MAITAFVIASAPVSEPSAFSDAVNALLGSYQPYGYPFISAGNICQVMASGIVSGTPGTVVIANISDSTATGQALMAAASAAAARTTLGATSVGSSMFTAADQAAQTALMAAATTALKGTVKMAANVAAITPAADGTTAGTALNAVIAAMITAGLMHA